MEDEKPQNKGNNFDTNRATVNYSNLVPTFPRSLDPTMFVNRTTPILNEVSLSSTCFSLYPKLWLSDVFRGYRNGTFIHM